MLTIDEAFSQIDEWSKTIGRSGLFEEIENTIKEVEDLRKFVSLWATEIGIKNIEKIQYKKKGHKEWDCFHLSGVFSMTSQEQHQHKKAKIRSTTEHKKNLHKTRTNGKWKT